MKVMSRVVRLVLVADLVGTDVLGDAAVLAGDDVRVAERIQQPGLTVVNVTHDGDDRRTCLELFVAFGLEFVLDVDVEGCSSSSRSSSSGETTWSL
jgi:hypothetical protein